MSKLVRIFKRGPDIRPTEACIVCGEPFGDMVHEITHEGSRHLYCQPTADAPVTAPATPTPGPWRVIGDCIRSDNHPDGRGALLLEAGPMFHNYTPNKEEIAANLRLAAAAPALLEAAQAVLTLSPDTYAIGSSQRGSDTEWDLQRKQDALRDAIAAATGKDQK